MCPVYTNTFHKQLPQTRNGGCRMANSNQILSIYLFLLLTQTCCSLKSSALFKFAVSGNSILAHNCAIRHFFYELIYYADKK